MSKKLTEAQKAEKALKALAEKEKKAAAKAEAESLEARRVAAIQESCGEDAIPGLKMNGAEAADYSKHPKFAKFKKIGVTENVQ